MDKLHNSIMVVRVVDPVGVNRGYDAICVCICILLPSQPVHSSTPSYYEYVCKKMYVKNHKSGTCCMPYIYIYIKYRSLINIVVFVLE
jgi:hypothetical protein